MARVDFVRSQRVRVQELLDLVDRNSVRVVEKVINRGTAGRQRTAARPESTGQGSEGPRAGDAGDGESQAQRVVGGPEGGPGGKLVIVVEKRVELGHAVDEPGATLCPQLVLVLLVTLFFGKFRRQVRTAVDLRQNNNVTAIGSGPQFKNHYHNRIFSFSLLM